MRYLGLAVLFMSMFFVGCASRSVKSETPEYRAAVMLQKAWDGKAIDKVMAANPDAILHEEPKYDWSTREITRRLLLPTACGGWFIEYWVDDRNITSYWYMRPRL